MWKLKRFLKHYKKEVILGPIFKLTEAIFELIVPLVMAKIIDVGIAGANTGYILKMGGIMLLLGFVGLCCALTCQYFAARASQGFGTEVRNNLFRHINTFSYAELDRFGTPSLITRVTNDVNQAQQAVAMTIRLAFRAPFLIIGATVMAMILDLKLSAVFFVTTPLIAVALYFVMSRTVPHFKSIQKKLDGVSAITRENLSGARVIRAFSKQDREITRFDSAAESLKHSSVKAGILSVLLNPLTTVIMNLAVVAIIWFGGVQVNTGALTQGQVIAFVNYMTQILLALVVLANLIVIFTKAAASSARINEVFEVKTSVADEGNIPVEAEPGSSKIEFKNVAFRYPGSQEDAVRGLTLAVNAGETIGIIGGTGAGKSTLVSLIPRFYDATEGEVLVDGVNVIRYPLKQLRGKIGLVPQGAVLFSGTVAENLRWGNSTATDAELFEAAAISQSAEFIENLPERYETRILQGGKNLSGGQKQRLTIARALVGKPEILILDDASSALDYATDAKLRAALAEKVTNAAVFMISQRANAIRHADKIVVVSDGQIAGIGTHGQLFHACGPYREICLSQGVAAEEQA